MKLNELNCPISGIREWNSLFNLLLVVASSRQIIIITLFNYYRFFWIQFSYFCSLSISLAPGEECVCRDWHGCIMAQSIVGLENVQPYKFSECSKNDYIDLLRISHGGCMMNKPNEVSIWNWFCHAICKCKYKIMENTKMENGKT